MLSALQRFEAMFQDDAQHFMFATEEPTAPDLCLFGVMHHLVDHSGDAGLPPCFPNLLQDAGTPRLAAWFDRMKSAYPMEFRARRLPAGEQVQLDLRPAAERASGAA